MYIWETDVLLPSKIKQASYLSLVPLLFTLRNWFMPGLLYNNSMKLQQTGEKISSKF